MEYCLLPHFHADDRIQKILIVGVAHYSAHYDEYFNHKQSVYSIDPDTKTARFGCKDRHFIDYIQHVDQYFDDGTFDCVLMNGVYGHGLDKENDLQKALDKVYNVLGNKGILLFGWDKQQGVDPIDLDSKSLFEKYSPYTINGSSRIRITKKGQHHIFDIYQKKSKALNLDSSSQS